MSDSVEHEVPGPRQDTGLAEEERAELTRLRAEVAEYRSAGGKSGGRRLRFRWRPVTAFVLVLFGCVLMPLSVVGVWARNQVTDTDRYVANVAPLAADPDVQNAIADRITSEVFKYVDVSAITAQALDVLVARGLPPATANQLKGLSGPLANGVRGFVRGKVGEVVASPAFQQAWVTANRVAHEQLVMALSGDTSGAVTVSEGTVSLDLAPFVASAKQSLVSAGFSAAARIPDIHPQFTLFASSDLARAQTAYRMLERLGTILPWVAIGLIVLGVYVAGNHRRALVGAGLGVAASMLLLGVAIAIGRAIYIDRIPEDVLSTTTAATVFDTLVRFVRAGLRTVLVVGLVVAAAAFFSGPSATAVRTRHGSTAAIGWLREHAETAGLRTGPVGSWVHANLTVLRLAVVALAALIFVFLDRPSGMDVLVLAGLAVLALVVLQFLARPPRADAEPSAPAAV
jgi:hypothetical protein